MSEFQPKQHERESNQQELTELANERRQELYEKLEKKTPEREKGHELEGARHETKQVLKSKEKEKTKQTSAETNEVHREPNKRDKNVKYDAIMQDTRQHMSPAARTFSKIIHHPAVEKVSDVSGKTIARPNAVLAGSMMAFALVLAVYLIARHYGYPLSGTETIIAFAFGWVLGLIFDYFKAMYTGGRSF